MISILKNKKGDDKMPIFLFVMGMIIVCLAVLALFVYNHYKFESEIYDSSFLDSVFYKETQMKGYSKLIVEKTIISSYSQMIIKEGQGIFTISDVNEKYIDLVREEIKLESRKYQFEDQILDELKNKMLNGNFEVKIEQGKIMVDFGEFSIISALEDKDKKEIMKAVYNPKILVMTNLTEFGLEDFGTIGGVWNQCKSVIKTDEMQKCFNDKLINFEAKVNELDGKKSVSLNTKMKFLIGNELKNIEIKGIL